LSLSLPLPLLCQPSRCLPPPTVVSPMTLHTSLPPSSLGTPVTYRNLSWPAVSQICSFTVFPPTLTTRDPNSTPIVWLESCLTGKKRKKKGSAEAQRSPHPPRPPPLLQTHSHSHFENLAESRYQGKGQDANTGVVQMAKPTHPTNCPPAHTRPLSIAQCSQDHCQKLTLVLNELMKET
jgi:hypothetical protein